MNKNNNFYSTAQNIELQSMYSLEHLWQSGSLQLLSSIIIREIHSYQEVNVSFDKNNTF